MQLNRFAEALSLYAPLVEQTTRTDIWLEYGHGAAVCGDFDLADQIWQKILHREPNNGALHWQIAKEYTAISLFSKAGALCAKAAKIEPGNKAIQLGLLSHLAVHRRAEQARAALDDYLKLDPNSESARYYSAHVNRLENKLAEAEQQVRDLLTSGPRDLQILSSCHLELAHIYDRTERFDEAMDHLGESKRIASRNINAEAQRKAFADRREKILRTTNSFPRDILEIWAEMFPAQARTTPAQLAFLGGSIRSGTTLLEKIIGAHPSIVGYDESRAFQTVLPSVHVAAPNIPAETLNSLRERFLKNLTMDAEPPGEGKILLDKNPGATVDLPALLRLFPEMRVLIALRDPRDVLVSSYFYVMKPPFSMERLAQIYSCVMDVWLLVREWKGFNWMETRYEDVVADMHKEGARVTTFLGLEWHENQTRFYASNAEKPVKNSNEVSKPVYSKAIGRWKAYERHLAPYLPLLEPYCKAFGYSS